MIGFQQTQKLRWSSRKHNCASYLFIQSVICWPALRFQFTREQAIYFAKPVVLSQLPVGVVRNPGFSLDWHQSLFRKYTNQH